MAEANIELIEEALVGIRPTVKCSIWRNERSFCTAFTFKFIDLKTMETALNTQQHESNDGATVWQLEAWARRRLESGSPVRGGQPQNLCSGSTVHVSLQYRDLCVCVPALPNVLPPQGSELASTVSAFSELRRFPFACLKCDHVGVLFVSLSASAMTPRRKFSSFSITCLPHINLPHIMIARALKTNLIRRFSCSKRLALTRQQICKMEGNTVAIACG